MARGKATPVEEQQSDRIAVNLDTATKRLFTEAAKRDGIPEVSVWLKALARRRMLRQERGAATFAELRKDRDSIVKQVMTLFSVLETEEELEAVAVLDDVQPSGGTARPRRKR